MAKRITNQEAKIARLEAELLKAKKAQLAFEQKKFEENDNRLEDLQKKMQSLEDLIATEESSIQKRLKMLLLMELLISPCINSHNTA